MEDQHRIYVNFDAIHRIVNREVAKKNLEPSISEQNFSPKFHFGKPQSSGKSKGRKAFKIDFSSIFSTTDCTLPKDVLAINDNALKNSDGIEHIHDTLAASDCTEAPLQNAGIEKSSHLHLKEQSVDEQVSRQGSDRENIQSACKTKLSSVDEDLLSLERMEEDLLTNPMVSSCLNHAIEKIIEDIILETDCSIQECELTEPSKGVEISMPKGCKCDLSDLRSQELFLQKIPELDVGRQNFESTPLADAFDSECNNADADMDVGRQNFETKPLVDAFDVECNIADADMVTSEGHLHTRGANMKHGAKGAYKLQVSHEDFAGEETQICSTGYNKALGESDRNSEDSHHKAKKIRHFSLSPVVKSNISPTLQLFRKRRSAFHVIAHDSYDPHNASIQHRILHNSRPSIPISQEEIESQKDVKQLEDLSEKGLNISNSSRLLTSADIRCKSKVKRKNEIKSTPHDHQLHEKVRSTKCEYSKQRTKRPLNWEDQECLQGGGSKWICGVRRSTRLRSRPLDFWKGERFLYGRILNCVSSVVGIKYTSPVGAMESKDKTRSFKVQSYVDDKYTDVVNFAALY